MGTVIKFPRLSTTGDFNTDVDNCVQEGTLLYADDYPSSRSDHYFAGYPNNDLYFGIVSVSNGYDWYWLSISTEYYIQGVTHNSETMYSASKKERCSISFSQGLCYYNVWNQSGHASKNAELYVSLEPFESLDSLVNYIVDRHPIEYRPINCTFPNAPTEAVVGETVTVPVSFPDGYGVVNPSDIYVTCNGVAVPSTYNNGTLTFTMPDPSQ